ncbi:MAG TPA: NAD(P)-dependent alcohol dehydrogenase [Egibacteraceae bacterium]|nr:NAD(P)-dependent alcohol dehydrogenase [Egibacteraceae bacterium]
MKAVRLHQYGERPRIDDAPEPVIEGPLDVIVRIGGAGVCRTDLHIVQEVFSDNSDLVLPRTLGHENAGWVHEVGSAVSNLAIGDPVILHPQISCGLCRACRDGDDMHCDEGLFPGISADGGFAELLKTSARSCVRLPEGVEPAAIAAQADAGLTAYHAVKKASARGLLFPGSRTVVIGAGGLGHIGIQALKAISTTEVIVVDRSDAALKLAAECGADQTVLADGGQVDAVLDLTDGKGAQAVIDFVGEGGVTRDGFAMLRRAGSYFVVGYGETLEVPTLDIIATERSFIGNLVGTYNDLVELMTLAGQGRITLHTRAYPLDAALDALDDLEHGRVRGRAVLVP